MTAILSILRKIWVVLRELFGLSNVVGVAVALAVPFAFAVIWIGVFAYVLSSINALLMSNLSGIFGGLPAGGLWLFQQVFPLQWVISMWLAYFIFRLAVAKLLSAAILATRKLKDK